MKKIMKNESISRDVLRSLTLLLILFLLLSVPGTAEEELIGTRTISNDFVEAGGMFSVNIDLEGHEPVYAPSVAENLPENWVLVPINNDGALFKDSTNEWLWVDSLGQGDHKLLVYNVNIPESAIPGVYTIKGTFSASKRSETDDFVGPIEIKGDCEITVEAISDPQKEKEKEKENENKESKLQTFDIKYENTQIVQSLPIKNEIVVSGPEVDDEFINNNISLNEGDPNENLNVNDSVKNKTIIIEDQNNASKNKNAPGLGAFLSVFVFLISLVLIRITK